ncbi:MAG: hypothetical protein MK102_18880 [Fuerstiella sp.]|nr:hypothetical protein [Fuerstiella sp.]
MFKTPRRNPTYSPTTTGTQSPPQRKRRKALNREEDDGEVNFGDLRSVGIFLGTGQVITCEGCGEAYGIKSEECLFCGAANPNIDILKQSARNRAKKRQGPSFFQIYRQPIMLGFGIMGICFALGLVVTAITTKNSGYYTHSMSGREQKEYYQYTTTRWIELTRRGKAHRMESLWQDNRWMPVESAVGLDWAALPDWFEALKHKNTRRLAESILNKWYFTHGHPYVEDIQTGMNDENPLVVSWSVVVARKLEHQNNRGAILPLLEKYRDGSDEKLSEESTKTLEIFKE